jgi:hypothetical protein
MSSRRMQRMLGRQNPQMDLADAVLWTGKIEPKPLVEKASFHGHRISRPPFRPDL